MMMMMMMMMMKRHWEKASFDNVHSFSSFRGFLQIENMRACSSTILRKSGTRKTEAWCLLSRDERSWRSWNYSDFQKPKKNINKDIPRHWGRYLQWDVQAQSSPLITWRAGKPMTCSDDVYNPKGQMSKTRREQGLFVLMFCSLV